MLLNTRTLMLWWRKYMSVVLAGFCLYWRGCIWGDHEVNRYDTRGKNHNDTLDLDKEYCLVNVRRIPEKPQSSPEREWSLIGKNGIFWAEKLVGAMSCFPLVEVVSGVASLRNRASLLMRRKPAKNGHYNSDKCREPFSRSDITWLNFDFLASLSDSVFELTLDLDFPRLSSLLPDTERRCCSRYCGDWNCESHSFDTFAFKIDGYINVDSAWASSCGVSLLSAGALMAPFDNVYFGTADVEWPAVTPVMPPSCKARDLTACGYKPFSEYEQLPRYNLLINDPLDVKNPDRKNAMDESQSVVSTESDKTSLTRDNPGDGFVSEVYHKVPPQRLQGSHGKLSSLRDVLWVQFSEEQLRLCFIIGNLPFQAGLGKPSKSGTTANTGLVQILCFAVQSLDCDWLCVSVVQPRMRPFMRPVEPGGVRFHDELECRNRLQGKPTDHLRGVRSGKPQERCHREMQDLVSAHLFPPLVDFILRADWTISSDLPRFLTLRRNLSSAMSTVCPGHLNCGAFAKTLSPIHMPLLNHMRQLGPLLALMSQESAQPRAREDSALAHDTCDARGFIDIDNSRPAKSTFTPLCFLAYIRGLRFHDEKYASTALYFGLPTLIPHMHLKLNAFICFHNESMSTVDLSHNARLWSASALRIGGSNIPVTPQNLYAFILPCLACYPVLNNRFDFKPRLFNALALTISIPAPIPGALRPSQWFHNIQTPIDVTISARKS
ncbi:uncharacterized protein BDR25DRAFT_351422 [Lindgomyces ingoldianus]|uniref:Uncharacterized protein n=1 Tax=Lindgomyces ingoldianus TaxID=673940 RepID=A0ACB6R703_9PLEO|nr:uncharacterized protein BDR25DRAFT_351422 [Lindgomyces ingoldianus]KAF2474941.1 hypothetical protein BDR25DRAFT_351422 [Lindgomyces ingoldianus]